MYYLIINRDEIVNGVKIHDGLNIHNSYFEFTDNKSVLKNIDDGYYLRKISVPIENQNSKVLNFKNKFRTNKLIFEDRYDLFDPNTWILMKDLGVNLHYNNEVALQWASKKGHLEIVQFLISNNSQIHVNNECSLQWASQYGHLKIVQLLISHNANIHADDECSLQWASANEYLEIVKLLILHGANVHTYNECALRWAFENKQHSIVELLIDYGADTKVLEE